MNNRLNIQDLAGSLAERTGKEKDEMERFLREFVSIISDGVCEDKVVKVKGLGIFKIISVEKRESVHVNTGERFLIPAHYKFSFLPDKGLRERVNKPFSIFETTEINENVEFSDMEESVDKPDMETEDESTEEILPDKEIPLEKVTSQPSLMEPADRTEPEPKSFSVSREKRRKGIFIGVSIAIAILLIIGFIAFHIKPRPVSPESPRAEETVPKEPEPLLSDSMASPIPVKDSISPAILKPKILGRETIKKGDRLTLIALKYYGNKLFWVYIYQYNEAIIKDPNNIPIGTEIEIPTPEMYGIDAKSQQSREKAAALQTEILSGE